MSYFRYRVGTGNGKWDYKYAEIPGTVFNNGTFIWPE